MKKKETSVTDEIVLNSINTFKSDIRMVLDVRLKPDKPGQLEIVLVSVEKI